MLNYKYMLAVWHLMQQIKAWRCYLFISSQVYFYGCRAPNYLGLVTSRLRDPARSPRCFQWHQGGTKRGTHGYGDPRAPGGSGPCSPSPAAAFPAPRGEFGAVLENQSIESMAQGWLSYRHQKKLSPHFIAQLGAAKGENGEVTRSQHCSGITAVQGWPWWHRGLAKEWEFIKRFFLLIPIRSSAEALVETSGLSEVGHTETQSEFTAAAKPRAGEPPPNRSSPQCAALNPGGVCWQLARPAE